MSRALLTTAIALTWGCPNLTLAQEQEPTLEEISIEGAVTANTAPVGTFGSPVSNLEYDPRIDLQSRNMAEAQADVTVRGGIFENTGFRLGSVTLLDPQTGHYVAEIPVAPSMLTEPSLQTEVDNALYGFNSTVATLSYDWTPINDSGSVSVAGGNNDFTLFSAQAAATSNLANSADWTLGFEGEYANSASDGTVKYGDHDFERISARAQLTGKNSQTDVFFGQQEKFFGWPNMYTPFGVNETEDLKTQLVLINHQLRYGLGSQLEISAYHRSHEDHYIFSRQNPAAFEAFHETKVNALGLSGRHVAGDALAVNYAAQLSEDDIQSTSLENNFTSRNYLKLSLAPEYRAIIDRQNHVTIRLGATFDDANRNDSELSAIGDISWTNTLSDAASRTLYLSYAETTQLAGYTAIGGSESAGLFRSNRDLGRESAKNLELGVNLTNPTWRLDAALFYRWDNDLTDWTYNFAATSARAANPVDIDTTGLEVIGSKSLDFADFILSYAFLSKSEDYGLADVDASFYALNFPKHRVTFGAIWRPSDNIKLRVDNEWREQEDNALRTGNGSATFTHLTLELLPTALDGVTVSLAADNLWDEDFQEIPGTPGRGRQFSAGLTYQW